MFPYPNSDDPDVINPYRNATIIRHHKFISHMGIAFVDVKTVINSGGLLSRTKVKKNVLRSVSGQFNYGTLNVILGSWRSGKSTLLKTLAGRNNQNVESESHFFVNSDLPPKVVFLDKCVEHNILFSLTVQELLEYAFKFRNPNSDSAERDKIIKDLISNFELRAVRDLELGECTPEERVQAQVAMTLATVDKPNLIFIDEPLDGIDPVGVECLVNLFKKLCRLYSVAITFSVGKILSSDYLLVFDKTYVLSRGGLCVYEGSCEHLSLFLRECGVIITSKIQTPMERLMKIASKPNQLTVKLANQASKTRGNILHLARKYGVHAPNGIQTEQAKVNLQHIVDLFTRSYLHKTRMYWRTIVSSFTLIVTFTLVLTSAFNDDIGHPNGCYNRTGNRQTVGRFVIMGERDSIDQSILSEVDRREEIDLIQGQHLIDENVKFVFVITAGLTLFQIAVSVRGLNEEVRVAINEHRNGWINISSFFLVKNVLDLVVPMVNTCASVLISYFLTGQILEGWRFFGFLTAQLLGVICAQSLGFTIGVIGVFNQRFTRLTLTIVCLVLIIFSGYLIPMAKIEPWLKVFAHLSFLKLSYELTLISLYGMQLCEQLHYSNSYVLDTFSIDYESAFWINSAVILVHFMLYRLVFWLILVIKVNKKSTIWRQPELVQDNSELEEN